MSNRNKLIIAIGLIVILVVAAIIATWAKKKQNQGQASTTTAEKVSDLKMLWPKISPDQRFVYYFSNEKEPAFFKYDLSSKQTTQLSEMLDTPDDVLWSPDFSKAILFVTYDKYVFEKYGSPYAKQGTADQAPTKWVYDFSNKKLFPLNSNITNILWLDNDQIIYALLNNNLPTINKAQFNGSGGQKLINLETIFVDKFIAFTANKLYFLGTPGEGIRNLYVYDLANNKIDEKIKDVGEDALTSPDNSKIILEQSKDNKTILYWSNIDSPNLNNTGIETTASLTAWVNNDQFLADIKTNKLAKLYSFDLNTNQKTATKIDLKNLTIDQGNLQIIDKFLFFTSNDILYKFELKNL